MAGVTQHSQTHHSHFPVLRPFSWINPNCRTPGTLLEPWAMGRLAGDQEPIGKKCPVPAPSIHGGSWVLVHWRGRLFTRFFG